MGDESILVEKPYIGKWISCIFRIGQVFLDKCFSRYSIGSGHYAYLLFLYRHDNVTPDMISKYLNVDKGNTTRAIAKLESLGYVRREVVPQDRRSYRVLLTDSGRGLEPEIRQDLRHWGEMITHGFTAEEKQLAYSLLERMADNAIEFRESMMRQGHSETTPGEWQRIWRCTK